MGVTATISIEQTVRYMLFRGRPDLGWLMEQCPDGHVIARFRDAWFADPTDVVPRCSRIEGRSYTEDDVEIPEGAAPSMLRFASLVGLETVLVVRMTAIVAYRTLPLRATKDTRTWLRRLMLWNGSPKFADRLVDWLPDRTNKKMNPINFLPLRELEGRLLWQFPFMMSSTPARKRCKVGVGQLENNVTQHISWLFNHLASLCHRSLPAAQAAHGLSPVARDLDARAVKIIQDTLPWEWVEACLRDFGWPP